MQNPMPARTVNRPCEVERRVLCSRYSECLEICLSKGWPGFSCSECHDFEFERPEDAAHWVEQGENSRWLLMNAGFFPRWIVERAGSREELEDFFCDSKKIKAEALHR